MNNKITPFRDIKDILTALKPLKNLIHINIVVLCIVLGLTAAGGISLVLTFLSLAVPILFLPKVIASIYLASLLVTIIVSIFLRPDDLKVINTADSLGLKERLITAYELKSDNSSLSIIQRCDAFNTVSAMDFRTIYKIEFPKRKFFISVILAFFMAIPFFIPAKPKEYALTTERVIYEIKKQSSKIEHEYKNIIEKAPLSDEKLNKLDEKINEMLNELRKSRKESEALKALSRAKHEVEKLKVKDMVDSAQVEENISENTTVENSGEASDNENSISGTIGDGNQLTNPTVQLENSALDQLMHLMDEVKYNIASSTGSPSSLSLAGDYPVNSQYSTGQQHNSGQQRNSGAQQNDGAQQGSTMQQNTAIQQGNESQQGAAAQQQGTGDNMAGSLQGASGNGATGHQGNGQGSDMSDKGGGGAGEGTSNRDLGYSGTESMSGGRAPGEKEVIEYESIYTPNRLGGYSLPSHVKGQTNHSGQSQRSEAAYAPVERGSVVPYNSILGEYRSEAMSAIERDSIPPVMKDIVRDYFTSLE